MKKTLPWNYWIQLIMKINVSLIMVFLVCQLAFAETGYSQEMLQRKITIELKNAELKTVLSQLSQKASVRFSYVSSLLPDQKISIKAKNESVESILNQILSGTRISYTVAGDFIVLRTEKAIKGASEPQSSLPTDELSEQPGAAPAFDKIISGRITSEAGEGLPGVTVSVRGTPIATASNTEGYYRIILPNDISILTFSMVGFVEQEIEVGKTSQYNIVMKDRVDDLKEVVVVGFGTQRRASVVGAITTIEPEKLQLGTSRSVSNNLAGQLAGVIGVQRSGEPGYDNANFWIRGISTFGGNRNPLVLVDGIERSLNNIDPEEIESFSILKDAAASAVYGVRGANGVILVNTKRGKIGKPKVSLRHEQAITKPVKLPSFVGAAKYLEVMNSIREERGEAGLFSQERIDHIRSQSDPDLYPDVNWLDAISKDQASNMRTNLTVSGGSNILRYAFVASYYGEKGIIERDDSQSWNSSMSLKRYNIRSNVDIDLSPTTLMRFNIGGYLQDRNRPPVSIDYLFQQAFITPPYVHPMRYASGEIPRTPQRQNPWALATQTGYERHSESKIESLLSLEQDLAFITPGLKARGTFSFDRFSNTSVTRSKSPDYYNPAIGRDEEGNLILSIESYGQEFLGYSTGSDWGNKSIYAEGNIFYTRDFGKSTVESMLLYNLRHYDDGSSLPFRNQGSAGRFSYSYDQRYVAEFNFGYNGSENFAKGKRYGFFPSVALGWLISEEPFMKPYSHIFTKLKIRASYGLVGNDQLDGRRFAYITTIGNTGGYSWGVNNDYYRAGRREGDQGNPDLTWETVRKTNLGFELGISGALDLQVDLFKENRSNIFMQRKSIPGSSGFINQPWANFGKVQNQGVDLSVDYRKRFNPDLMIALRGTFTYAVNKIIEQDEANAIKGTNRSSTGKPIGQIFGLQAEGLFTNSDFIDVEKGTLVDGLPIHTFGTVRPGDIKYRDLNEDGRIDALDNTAIGGTYDPQMVYGFGFNARYKAFDFGFFAQGNALTYRTIGGSNFIPGSANGSMGNMLTNVDDRWTVANPRQDVFYPRLSDYQSANNNQTSTWWLRDMRMLRLKNIELGYHVGKNWLTAIKIEGIRAFVRANNLLTASPFKLWDPEVDAINGLRYPIMKSFSVGLEINL
ncbi:TonB-dependent receptor [Dyadobacter tibetensis]|uniref:TonB-dependent receptor n=1 Tax=Dyadobacter tibetensis TaxID=1211851 RepID=UPI00046FF5F9|nr:TonB-dependent receptor [Dyadobacter tibetensis]